MQSFTRIVALQVDGHVIHTTPSHSFFTDKGWVDAGYLRAGDLLHTHDGTWATVQAVAGYFPKPSSGLLPAGTLIPTAASLKKVEHIEVGDHVVVPSSHRN